MSWRLARSLETLRDQVNALYPGRDKSSDGSIGDTSHQATKSDHNPNAAGVVTAIDITHDPAHGLDARKLAELLVASRDSRIKYIISNAQIISSKVSPWTWRAYTGANAHRHHVHISVDGEASLYDDARAWTILKPPSSPGKRQTSIIATVWTDAMGAYGPIDHSRPCVSLPAPFPSPRPRVRVYGPTGSAVGPITDKGPWYDGTATRPADPYWQTGARPRAETDTNTNGAGIDLNPAMAAAVGINGKGKVDWQFEQETPVTDEPKPPTTPSLPAPAPDHPRLDFGRVLLYLLSNPDELQRLMTLIGMLRGGPAPTPGAPVQPTPVRMSGTQTASHPVTAPAAPAQPSVLPLLLKAVGGIPGLGVWGGLATLVGQFIGNQAGLIGPPAGPNATTAGLGTSLAGLAGIIGGMFSKK